MTRPQLIQKHPKLAELAATGLFDDLANHLRRLNPFMGQTGQNFDASGIARHAGRLEGYMVLCEILQTVWQPLPEQKTQTPAAPYSEPPRVVRPN